MAGKNKKENFYQAEDPRFGTRADTAQLERNVLEEKMNVLPEVFSTRMEDLRHLSKETKALLRGFALQIEQAAKEKNSRKLINAWNQAKALVAEIEFNNLQAFANSTEVRKLVEDQKDLFEKATKKIFGEEDIITFEEEKIISTREGGLKWGLGQLFLILATPQVSTITQTRETNLNKGSTKKEVTTTKKVSFDGSLFDDYIHITWQGIEIKNASSNKDSLLIPWSETGNLIFTSDASALVDPINKYIRPLSKKTAQSSWQPIGLFKIKDRSVKESYVKILMTHPDEFRKKVEQLRKTMQPNSISIKEVEPREPITIEQFVQALPPNLTEEVLSLIEEARSKERRFSKENKINVIGGEIVTPEQASILIKDFFERIETEEELEWQMAHPLLVAIDQFFERNEIEEKLPPKIRKAVKKLKR